MITALSGRIVLMTPFLHVPMQRILLGFAEVQESCADLVQISKKELLCSVSCFMQVRNEVIMKQILIVDDEIEILKPLEEMLIEEGYSVRAVENPLKALDLIKQYHFDLSILDIKMPEMNGLDLINEARKIKPSLPVIFLSSKNDDIDAVVGMTAGADDYVGKPFTKQLLLLRIKSVLRRHSTNDIVVAKPIEVGHLSIDRDRHLVTWKEENIDLTVTECLLLMSLAERPGVVKKRQQLIDACYDGTYVSDRTVDSHVRNIRAKFKDLDNDADIIGTVQGLGYKLKL